MGSPWDPLGGPWGCLAGSLRVLGVALGSLGGPWGDPGGPKGDLGEPRGGLLELLVKRKITETRLVFICFSQYGVPGVASKRAVGPLEGCGEVPWGPKGHQRDPRELQESPQGSSRGAVGGPRSPRGCTLAPQGHGRAIPEVLTFFQLSRTSVFLRKYSVFHITQNRYPRSSREARGDPGEVLGGPWGPLGGPWGCLGGSLRVLGVALGSLGGPWGPWGSQRGSRGASGGPFWSYWGNVKSLKNRCFCFSQYGVPGVASERALGPLEGHGEVPWGPRGRQRGPRELQASSQGGSGGAVGGPRCPQGGPLGPPGGAWGVRRKLRS